MTGEDNILLARLHDAVLNAGKRQFPAFLGFLNEHEISVALRYINSGAVTVNYRFFGGCEDSERCFLAVAGKGVDIEDYYFPISAICIRYKKDFKLSHRDFLGSLMGLGIKRETVGDILISDGYAVVFVKSDVEKYILSQLTKIGSVGVDVSLWDGSASLPIDKKMLEVNITVASARLDSVVSAVYPLSRERSAAAIRQGLVFVNDISADSVSRTVKPGDKISVRGNGKFLVSDFFGTTKKGRLKLTVEKYI